MYTYTCVTLQLRSLLHKKKKNILFFLSILHCMMFFLKFETSCNIINLFCSLSIDTLYISCFKASSPERAISCFLFQYPVSCISLRSSSSYLILPPYLPITSILPSIFPSVTCSTRKILHKMWPIQLIFLLFIVCRIFLSSLTLSHIS
jgi:hypothetical protein